MKRKINLSTKVVRLCQLINLIGINEGEEYESQEIYVEQYSEEVNPEDPMLLAEDEAREMEEVVIEQSQEEAKLEEEKEVEWDEIEGDFIPNWLQDYTLQAGPQHLPEDTTTPLHYFSLFFSEEIIDMLVTETNRYAIQYLNSNPDKKETFFFKGWTPCNRIQIKAYLGLLIHMGLLKLPRLDYHWRSNNLYCCPLCPNVMKRIEFMRIHSFFHIANNENANLQDKLYKLRPLITKLSSSFTRYYVLHKELTVDEKMIKYTGRVSFLQHVRNKPIRFGFKVFVLSDAISGYVYSWSFYTGANPNGRVVNLALYKVLELIQGLEHRNHHLYFDSYYTSIPLAQELSTRGFGCAGTINQRRKFIPIVIKNPPSSLLEGQAIFRRRNDMIALVYKDKKDVRILSTIHGNQIHAQGMPLAVRDYNAYMRGVDRGNQNTSYYHPNHKSMKWWKTIFIALVKTSIANSYILYQSRNPFNAQTPLKFREELVLELVNPYISQRHTEALNTLPRGRIIAGMHEIGQRKPKRNCFVCSTKDDRVTTEYYCIQCDRHVCILKCFYILHSKLNLNLRNKKANLG